MTRQYLHDNTLWHECGHAVIAHVMGAKVALVNGDRNDSAHCSIDVSGLANWGIVYLAGPIAEQVSRRGRIDAATLQNIYENSGAGDIRALIDAGVSKTQLRFLEREAKKLVRQHWQTIKRVRLALEDTDDWRLTAKQLASLCAVSRSARTA